MRVALDATYSVGDRLSGVGVYSRQLLDGLATHHAEANYLWCYRPHRFVRSLPLIPPRHVRRRLLLDSWPPACDVFHGLNQRLPVRRAARTVSTFHDLFVMTADYSTPEFRARFAAQAREAAERSDLIIAVSQFTAQQVEDLLGVPAARIRVVPHGVPQREPGPPQSERAKTILSVGALQRRKNTMRLVEAFERTPPGWKLVLAGSTGFDSERILRRIAESSRSRDIVQTGYVSDSTRARLYEEASIFAFPSLDEGFGIPVLEAMAAGAAVLTSHSGALREVAGGAAMLVDPLDVTSISDGLAALMSVRALREQFSAAGYERVARFTWQSAVDQTWNVYRELAASAGGR
ncbi:MAG: glycosyltransferase family 4 protein [Bryobacterales bacterium]|nr:glycosyltransferase family 4 protein [Bryobacterales bacterium]